MGRTRRQLAAELAVELGISEALALRVIRRLFEKLTSDLVESGRVELRGFGSFRTITRPAQKLRSPKTGLPVQVPAYRSVQFRAAQELRHRLAGAPAEAATGRLRQPSTEGAM